MCLNIKDCNVTNYIVACLILRSHRRITSKSLAMTSRGWTGVDACTRAGV